MFLKKSIDFLIKPKIQEKNLSILENANYAQIRVISHFSFLVDQNQLITKLARSTEKINWSPMTLVAINDTRFSKKAQYSSVILQFKISFYHLKKIKWEHWILI